MAGNFTILGSVSNKADTEVWWMATRPEDGKTPNVTTVGGVPSILFFTDKSKYTRFIDDCAAILASEGWKTRPTYACTPIVRFGAVVQITRIMRRQVPNLRALLDLNIYPSRDCEGFVVDTRY